MMRQMEGRGFIFPNTHFICMIVNRVGLPLVVLTFCCTPVFMHACPLEVCLLKHFSKHFRHA